MKNVLMTIVAVIRLIILVPTIAIGATLTLIGGVIPGRIRGANMAQWMALFTARAFNFVLNVHVDVESKELLRKHRGFIFPTHDTYLDIVLPVSITPMRFVAAVEVLNIPFIGRMGKGFGVVYMDRRDKADRARVRELLKKEDSYPPIVIYPEGMLDGKPGIAPFRYGAFELAQSAHKSYLPIATVYDPFWNVKWKGESVYNVLWRQAKTWRVQAKMIPLQPVTPMLNDDPKTLANSAERAIIKALANSGYPDYAVVDENEDPVKPTVSWETDPNA